MRSFPDLSPVFAASKAFELIGFELDHASAFGTNAIHNRGHRVLSEGNSDRHIASLFVVPLLIAERRSVHQRAENRLFSEQSSGRLEFRKKHHGDPDSPGLLRSPSV